MEDKEKLRVGIIFGGRSAEHEVSLQSARSIINAINRSRFDLLLIGIDKNGEWHLLEEGNYLEDEDDPSRIGMKKGGKEICFIPSPSEYPLIELSPSAEGKIDGKTLKEKIDLLFPVLHGPYGEDGTIQGLFELADIPFVGADVIGSAIGMDKDVTKRLLKEAGIDVAPFITIRRIEWEKGIFTKKGILSRIEPPLFVKPANLGSSVGITLVKDEGGLEDALKEAFQYDTKILVEKRIEGREIECSVIGNDEPVASVPGEVIPSHPFYSYVAKYIDQKGAILEIPAKLTDEEKESAMNLSVKAFKVLCCKGMARVDLFLEKISGKIYVNEINTIPGFTRISMFPKLWEATGLPYPKLIEKLFELAFERHEQKKALKKDYGSLGALK